MMQNMSFEDRVKAVTPRLQEIVDIINFTKDPKIIELRDEAIALLRKYNLIVVRRVRADFVGVHPSNRYGDGVVPSHVHQLLARIFGKGFSLLAIDMPFAVEAAPQGYHLHTEHCKANHEMVLASQGLLPPYDSEGKRIQIFSASCGHTNQGLRCFLHGAPSTHPELSEDGKLSLTNLRQRSPAYADCVEEGITWDIIPWQIEVAVPGIMTLFQEKAF